MPYYKGTRKEGQVEKLQNIENPDEKAPSYESLKADIGVCLNNAANDFFRIGYSLRQVKERQLFLEDGYHNIWEFAKEEYGLSMSSASRFMSINAKFSVNDGKEMDPKYIGMGSSKLQEMLGLPEEELEKVTQNTPVREIRRIVSQVKSIETLAKQCEATGSCPDENTSCIAGEKVGTDEGKELCLKCWKGFLKTHPDWKPGIRMEKLLEENAKGTTCDPAEEDSGAGNTEPDEETEKEAETEERLSFFGLPKMVYPEGSLLSTPGCGSGKYSKHDCFSCSRECAIRQKERHCVEAPCGNPFPCQITGNEEWKSRNRQNIYQDKCQMAHPELAPVRPGDKEPEPCCLYCDIKLCYNRCDVAKKRDEAGAIDPVVEVESSPQEASKPARPEPSRKDIKAFYDWIRHWISEQPGNHIDAAELKNQYRNAGGGGVGFQYDGSARGVRINNKKEITWNEAAKRLNEIQEEERKSGGCAEASEAEKETARRLEKDRRLLDFYRAVYPGTRQIIAERNRDAITKELRAVYGNTYENGEGWFCYPDKIVFRDKPGAEQDQIPWGRFAAELEECLNRFPETEKSILSEDNRQMAPEVIDADFKEIDDAAVSEQSGPEKVEKRCYSFGDVERLLRRNKATLEDCINFMQGDDDPPPVFLMSHIYVDALELLLREIKKNMDEDTGGDDR